jgi:Domain of unknown function (DUF4184)
MPFTFFAHQVPVLPLKIRWPDRFDGTALCIGAMTPDLAYGPIRMLARNGHHLGGWLFWSAPATFVICRVIRRWVASVTFAYLPDAGPLRLHSYRVLSLRRPAWWRTLLCGWLGAGSHIVLDGFTHDGRFGSDWLGWGDRITTIGDRSISVANILQYSGHTAGSLVGLLLLVYIGHRRLLERWYGESAVAEAREFTVTPEQRRRFWRIVVVGLVPVPMVFAFVGRSSIFVAFNLLGLSTAIASRFGACVPTEIASTGHRPAVG